MRDVLHTKYLGTAEALRVALLAEGIDSSVRGEALENPSAFTVSVHEDAQYEQAVRIRQDVEHRAAQAAGGGTLRPRVVVAIVVVVVTAMWWLFRG